MKAGMVKGKRKSDGKWIEGWLFQHKFDTDKYFIRHFPESDDHYEDDVIDIRTISHAIAKTDYQSTLELSHWSSGKVTLVLRGHLSIEMSSEDLGKLLVGKALRCDFKKCNGTIKGEVNEIFNCNNCGEDFHVEDTISIDDKYKRKPFCLKCALKEKGVLK